MINPHLDTNARVNQPNQRRGNPNKVGCSTIRRTSVPRDVGDEATANDESGLGSDGTVRVHGVDNVEHGLWG